MPFWLKHCMQHKSSQERVYNNTLFVQYHEQEIPEVIPIEGIPFVNQSKSNQINLTQHKSNQIKFWFLRRGENRSTRRKTSRSRVQNQQTQPTFDAESGNRTRATLVGGERSDIAPTLLPMFDVLDKPNCKCKPNIFHILFMQSRLVNIHTLGNSTVFNFGFNHLDAIIFQIKVDFTSDGKHKTKSQSVNTHHSNQHWITKEKAVNNPRRDSASRSKPPCRLLARN